MKVPQQARKAATPPAAAPPARAAAPAAAQGAGKKLHDFSQIPVVQSRKAPNVQVYYDKAAGKARVMINGAIGVAEITPPANGSVLVSSTYDDRGELHIAITVTQGSQVAVSPEVYTYFAGFPKASLTVNHVSPPKGPPVVAPERLQDGPRVLGEIPGEYRHPEARIVPQPESAPAAAPAPAQTAAKPDPGVWSSVGEYVHGALDVAGLVPGLGEIADGVNAVIYLAEGRYVEAAISAAAMIPVVGDLGKAGKWAVKGGKEVAEALVEKGAREVAEGIVEKGGKEATETLTEVGAREGAEAATEKGSKEVAESAAETGGKQGTEAAEAAAGKPAKEAAEEAAQAATGTTGKGAATPAAPPKAAPPAAAPPAPKPKPKPKKHPNVLKSSDQLRREARDIFYKKFPHLKGKALEIDHRIPLEYRKWFPNADPNRLNNLRALTKEEHRRKVSDMWDAFRNTYRRLGRLPTAQEIADFAKLTDKSLGLPYPL